MSTTHDLGFSIETVELGLRLTVLSGGDVARASKLMTNEGEPVDARTLRSWKEDKFAHRYEQLVDEIRRELDIEIRDTSSVIATQAHAMEQELLRELQEKLHDVPAKDLARSVHALAQTASTHVQVNRLLSEKPTSIVETRAPAELLAELRELGVIEGSGEEISTDSAITSLSSGEPGLEISQPEQHREQDHRPSPQGNEAE